MSLARAIPRLVLDTNVVLDGLVFDDPLTRPLWAALQSGTVCALANAATLDELRCVLRYSQFGLSPETQAAYYAQYLAQVEIVETTHAPALPRCRDPDDQKFLELAATANAGVLVSKDLALLHLKGRTRLAFRIVMPADALLTPG